MSEEVNNPGNYKALADLELTERELRHLAAGWLSNHHPEDFDANVFTILTGHPNVTNARKRFSEIKKKVRIDVFGTATPDFANVKVRAVPKKRAAKANDGDPDSVKTPAKRRKSIKAEPETPTTDKKASSGQGSGDDAVV